MIELQLRIACLPYLQLLNLASLSRFLFLGIGIGSAMQGLATAGMVDMQSVVGAQSFNMENFDPADFASMNVAEMGMNPAMMTGALEALPVGAATAALETLAANPRVCR